MSHLIQNYKRFNIGFKSGKGCYLIGYDGKKYLDFLAGVGVLNLGYSHKSVLSAVRNKSKNLFHVSNYYQIEEQEKLAELLCKNTFAKKCLFVNSGTESVESALKLARKYAFDNFAGAKKHNILALNNSFHGRTYGSLSATGQGSKQDPFKPLLLGFDFIDPNNEKALERKLDDSYCAVILEPILGEGGVIPLNKSFIEKARHLCDKHHALLIFDEVQTGNGRTGNLFAYQYTGVIPDILVTSKGLGNGFPIGALMTKEHISLSFSYGSHGCTFGGNPLACSAGIAVITEMTKRGFLNRVNKISKYFFEELNKLKNKFPNKILEIRGKGLMIGIKVSIPSIDIVNAFLERKILTNSVKEDTIRLLPPLIVTKKEIDIFINNFDEILGKEL